MGALNFKLARCPKLGRNFYTRAMKKMLSTTV
jgi:hypothetical protein